MDWKSELESLSSTKMVEKCNSSLKKKLTIINELKNIKTDNVEYLKNELLLEDMEKFTTEIITIILTSEVNCSEDIKNIVRITSSLVHTENFIKLLMTELSKLIKSKIDEEKKYWIVPYLLDIHTLLFKMGLRNNQLQKNIVDELCQKMNEEPKILFLEYLKNNYDGDYDEIIKKQTESITIIKTESESLKNAAKTLGIKIENTVKINNFKKIIEIEKHEFNYYNCKSSKSDHYEGNIDAKEINNYISMNFNSLEKLDSLGKSLKDFNNQKLIINIFLQLKQNLGLTAGVAKVITSSGKLIQKKTISILLKEAYGTKEVDIISSGLLLTELCKFREVDNAEIFKLLAHLFNNRKIIPYCSIFSSIGRFFLILENTNYKMREQITKLRNFLPQATLIERTHINNAFFKIFSENNKYTTLNLKEFLRYFFRNEVFAETSELWQTFMKNKKLLLFFLMHPWEYESLSFLAYIANISNLIDNIANLIIATIPIIYKISKQKSLSFISYYAEIIKLKNEKEASKMIETLFKLSVDDAFKAKILIRFFQSMNKNANLKYFKNIEDLVLLLEDKEIDIQFFNLCEEKGIKYIRKVCDDSFEDELKSMSYI